MKNAMFAVLSLVLGLAPLAHADKATEIPACATIVPQCESAGFEPGEHKKNGKGLWVDCIGKVAKGNTIAGVTATRADAKGCLAAHRAMKKAK